MHSGNRRSVSFGLVLLNVMPDVLEEPLAFGDQTNDGGQQSLGAGQGQVTIRVHLELKKIAVFHFHFLSSIHLILSP